MNKNHRQLVKRAHKSYVAYKRGRGTYDGPFPMGHCEPLDNKPKVAAGVNATSTVRR